MRNVLVNDPLAYEPGIRALAFCVTTAALILAEAHRPRRPRRGLRQMWQNVGLLLANTVAVRLVSATSLAGFAVIATANGWGLLNRFDAPSWAEFGIAVVALDLNMYVQHRLFHWLPWLWRLHAVHHSDTWFDVSTGVRFHVGEILVSFAIKLLVVLALGASVWAVIVFEALLSAASLFTHANVRLAKSLDTTLRYMLVTPDVHRVHHSTEYDEHNRNFGFLLIWWDRLFRSYRAIPRGDPQTMPIGLSEFRAEPDQRLVSLFVQPFSTRYRTLDRRS